jgi:VWFA-related protein
MKVYVKIVCLIILSFSAALAQSYKFKIIKTTTDKFPGLTTYVSVTDNSDKPSLGLISKNFSTVIDNKKVDSVSIQSFQKSGKGISFMLCIDLSATMKGQPLQALKNSILMFIDNMRGIDKIGIMGFSDEAFLISDFSSDKEYLKEKIKTLTTSGSNTSLYYGIYKGLEKLIDLKTDDIKMLIVMGDGKNENNARAYSEEDVISKAKEEQIPVYSIGYSKINKMYLQTFEKISDKTNGTFYYTSADDQLNRNFDKLYNQVLNMYLVSFNVVNIDGDGKKHTITLTVTYNNEAKTKSNDVVFPAGIASLTSSGGTSKTNWVLYGGIAGAVVIIAGCILFFVLRNNKKKEELERQRLEAERRRAEEEEIKRRREQEAYRNQQMNIQNQKPHEDAAPNIIKEVDSDKTMILNSGSQKTAVTAIMKVEVGPYSGNNFKISRSGASIGRLDDNSIILKDNNVSKHHAKIIFSNGKFYIEDLQSTNGTYINTKKIINSVLNNGDVFKIGASEGRFQIQ